jgi:hypothetical protein
MNHRLIKKKAEIKITHQGGETGHSRVNVLDFDHSNKAWTDLAKWRRREQRVRKSLQNAAHLQSLDRKDFKSDVAETYNEESYWPMIMDARVEIRVLRRFIKCWQPSKEDSHELRRKAIPML